MTEINPLADTPLADAVVIAGCLLGFWCTATGAIVSILGAAWIVKKIWIAIFI